MTRVTRKKTDFRVERLCFDANSFKITFKFFGVSQYEPFKAIFRLWEDYEKYCSQQKSQKFQSLLRTRPNKNKPTIFLGISKVWVTNIFGI
jgi:hypothetical protein